jgi:hypothetical protein
MVKAHHLMKKFVIFCILARSITSLYSEPSFTGKMELYNTTSLAREEESDATTSNTASALLTFDMATLSNGVKFYGELLVEPKTMETDLSNVTFTLHKAYVKYRIPYKESYLNFQGGKSYYDMGGGLVYNAGNSFIEDSAKASSTALPTRWIVAAQIPLYTSPEYHTLFVGPLVALPLEDEETGVGAFMNYGIRSQAIDAIEMNLLYEENQSTLSFGYNGTLFFDYGLYAKVDFSHPTSFDISCFASKMQDKMTYYIEALYQNESETNNEEKTLFITPYITYQNTDKLRTVLSDQSIICFKENEVNFDHTAYLEADFSIVNGLMVSATLSTSFIQENLVSLILGMEYKY